MSNSSQQGTGLGPLSFLALLVFLIAFFNTLLWLIAHKMMVRAYANILSIEAALAWAVYWFGRLVLPLLAVGFAGWWMKEKLAKKKHPLAWLPFAASGALGAGVVVFMLLVLAKPLTFAEPGAVLFSLGTMKENPGAVEFGDIATFAGLVGRMYWPFLACIVVVYGWRGKIHPRNKYRFAHNMESFLADMSQEFKATVPILHLDPIDKLIKGYEPSRSASDYCRHNELLRRGAIDLIEMKRLFAAELGERFPWRANEKKSYKAWTYDLAKLEPWAQAIFAVLSACICKNKEEGLRLRDALNESARGSGKPDLALAAPILQRYGQDEAVRKVIAGHQYTRTALFEMFVSVREWALDLHPAQFIWLKPTDRAFWYAQHTTPLTLDRIDFAANAEGMGIVAQWQCERVARQDGGCWHPRAKPCFVSAAYGLCAELFKTGTIGDDEWDRLKRELPEIYFDFDLKTNTKAGS